MFWFIIHNILKSFSSMENQTRNLTTYLSGTFLYVLFYSYTGSIVFNNNSFFKEFFIYIMIADAFSMAILYKDLYEEIINKQTTDKQTTDKQTMDKQTMDKQTMDKQTTDKQTMDKQTTFTDQPKISATKVKSISKEEVNIKPPKKKIVKNDENILLLNETSDYVDNMEGFIKDTAYGDAYSTNGKSNI